MEWLTSALSGVGLGLVAPGQREMRAKAKEAVGQEALPPPPSLSNATHNPLRFFLLMYAIKQCFFTVHGSRFSCG